MPLTVAVGAVTAAQATTIGKMLVADGQAYAYIRIMWEMNGNWFPWGIDGGSLGYSAATYVSVFRTAVDAFRAVPGNHFQIVWNVNGSSSVPTAAYPGSAYVNDIGVDQYDYSGYPSNMNAIIAFAKSQGKPLQVDEWGVMRHNDPTYVNTMASFMNSADDISLQVYFDNGSNVLTDYPAALSAYEADFG